MKRGGRILVVTLALLATLLPARAAIAQDSDPEKGDDFSVSLPADPVTLKPGESGETSMRIVNRSDKATNFHIDGVILETKNEGQVVVTEGSDDWTKSVQVAESISVPPADYVEIPVKFTVPSTAKADIHLLGFAIAPIRPSSGKSIDVRTRAVTYLPVDVAGDAHRSIKVTTSKLPKLVLGQDLNGTINVENTGDAGLRFRAQVFLNSAITKKNIGVAQAGDKSAALLLPVERSRTVAYSWHFKGLITVVRPKVEVGITGGDKNAQDTTKNLPIVLMVNRTFAQVVCATAGALAFVGLVFLIRKLIRRRKQRSRSVN